MYLIQRPSEIMIMREREAHRPWPWTGVKEKPLPGEEEEEEEEENEERLTHNPHVNEWAKRREKTIPSYPYFIWVFLFCWLLVVSPHTYSHSLPSAYSSLVVMPKKKQKKQPPWRGMTHFDYQHVIFLFSLSFLTFFFTSYNLRFVLFTHGCVCVCSGTARTQGTGAVA